MGIKLFKFKNLIIYGISVIISVFGVFCINYQVSAVVGDDTEPVAMRVVGVNPSINVTDDEGWTIFMRAILEHDSELVKNCLKQDADLRIMPLRMKNRYSNAFEYLLDQKVAWEDREDSVHQHGWHYAKFSQCYYDMLDAIFNYCVAKELRLRINKNMLDDHPSNIKTVWDERGKEYFKAYGTQYHNAYILVDDLAKKHVKCCVLL